MTPDTIVMIVLILAGVLAAWAALRFLARVVAALLVIGLLVAGLAVLAGRLTDQQPHAIVDTVVATLTAEATRTAHDLPTAEDFGRLDRMGGAPTPATGR